jgi:hypothetical protein
MWCIVPLAGPDFLTDQFGVRPLMSVEGEPLIRRALATRAWVRSGRLSPERIVFVLRDMPQSRDLEVQLSAWFPGSGFVFLSRLTGGALLSAVAGAALLPGNSGPVAVDLVDILYDMDDSHLDRLAGDGVGAGAPWFPDSSPAYSYLETSENGDVVRTREKAVISNKASAGTYFFSGIGDLLSASAYGLEHGEELSFRGTHFLCPSLNGVVARGKRVLSFEASNVKPVSKLFHV